ncbi:hypothetical protein GJAV_G00165090 [Gymnothorax javanicus]|nr:hypothetical protein GJAV_G00165090 [Gymnothorax javanicus]
MTDVVVVEGLVRLRDGKKWKSRWVTLRKPSPVADCLILQAHGDKSDKANGNKERWGVTLEDICGLEPGLAYEEVPYSLSVVCLSLTVVLGFNSREALLVWEIRIRLSLGEVHRFPVRILPGTKLGTGPAALHLCNNLLAITRDIPPSVIGWWNLPDLRRYGAVPNGFIFEGGTRCGYWAGVFFLSCAEGKRISFLFDCIVRGISPTRAPFGLGSSLPDPAAGRECLDERLNLEAEELEKRLSLLPQEGKRTCISESNTVSMVGGDDISIYSSSDTSSDSQSDNGMSSRLAVWAEPVINPAPAMPSAATLGVDTPHGEGKPVAVSGGVAHPTARQPRSKDLQEFKRQSSLDSGIATGSHSSHAGSFSSYTGSLAADVGHGNEFGLHPSFLPNLDLCTCFRVPDPNLDYQVPSSYKHLYDTPRNLFVGSPGCSKLIPPKDDQTAPSPFSPEPVGGSREPAKINSTPLPAVLEPELLEGTAECSSRDTPSFSDGCAPPREPPAPCHAASGAPFTACPTCGGLKGTIPLHLGLLSTLVSAAGKKAKRREDRRKADLPYEVMEGQGAERAVQCGDTGSYELMGHCGAQKISDETEGSLCTPVLPPRLKSRRDHGTAGEGAANSRYALIDIAATEVAHRVGTQHALCREERLQELPQKKRGTLQ